MIQRMIKSEMKLYEKQSNKQTNKQTNKHWIIDSFHGFKNERLIFENDSL